jgi:hypothetical protein
MLFILVRIVTYYVYNSNNMREGDGHAGIRSDLLEESVLSFVLGAVLPIADTVRCAGNSAVLHGIGSKKSDERR